MIVKKKVKLRIETTINEESSTVHALGELYVKDHAVYVRYVEPSAEMGQTITIVKLQTDSVKIIRHGDVEMEQLFSTGNVTNGMYNPPQGALGLEVSTISIDN